MDDDKNPLAEFLAAHQEWSANNREKLGETVASVLEPIGKEIEFFVKAAVGSVFDSTPHTGAEKFIGNYASRGITLTEELVEVEPTRFMDILDQSLAAIEDLATKARESLLPSEYQRLTDQEIVNLPTNRFSEESLQAASRGLSGVTGGHDAEDINRGAVLDDSGSTREKE